ncbi:hypothetical protein T4B_2389 [Trichinella pseudospiralis]|uniref:Uncharacterized protein n=2 Tax=Trichinella pseudospiralis TaxID=6337 RepID=A0A0V1FEU0_TRIPS|nr:hypothetical protein T4A_1946 [Trichinella pseudospiralis]KRY84567.1 hypothetical protein T4D_6275 [Trichinella pseudospiralis]KRZ24922.1 hypothetical protein T4B_2389 [Trichinella pseudospiralis]KRZ37798.1 hypothetical protein T4C_7686 [Trichinella pseudospiralis]
MLQYHIEQNIMEKYNSYVSVVNLNFVHCECRSTVITLVMNDVYKLVIDAQCFFVVLQLQISDLILAALRAMHCSNFV